VTPDTSDAPYTLRGIQQMLGISRGVIVGLVSAGFVSPTRGHRNEYRFTFQDVVLLRTAYSLQQAHIPPRTIHRSLKRLAATLPADLPMSGLRIKAIGKSIAVRANDAHWEADSGPGLIDFEVTPAPGGLAVLQRATAAAADDAGRLVATGENIEADDAGKAEAMYRRALELEPDCAAAYLNLGAMLCEAGRCGEAVQLYDQAVRHCPSDAAVHFNRAIALEDQGRVDEALASYEECLRLEPGMADAHFNAARLHELRGDFQRALRHFSAYRRLSR
jgi:tetratricopeptide (TPR) repeat protein